MFRSNNGYQSWGMYCFLEDSEDGSESLVVCGLLLDTDYYEEEEEEDDEEEDEDDDDNSKKAALDLLPLWICVGILGLLALCYWCCWRPGWLVWRLARLRNVSCCKVSSAGI